MMVRFKRYFRGRRSSFVTGEGVGELKSRKGWPLGRFLAWSLARFIEVAHTVSVRVYVFAWVSMTFQWFRESEFWSCYFLLKKDTTWGCNSWKVSKGSGKSWNPKDWQGVHREDGEKVPGGGSRGRRQTRQLGRHVSEGLSISCVFLLDLIFSEKPLLLE